MPIGRTLVLALLAGALPAQDLSLAERVASPLVHIAVGSHEAGAAVGGDWISDLETLGIDLSGGDPEQGQTAGSPGGALRWLHRLMSGEDSALAWTEIEFALTGILPRAGGSALPMLVFRARLVDEAAGRLRGLLERGSLARPARQVGGHQVYVLATGERRGPGSVIELALVGSDLVVSNHAGSMVEALDGGTRTDRDVLVADPIYRSLSKKLEVEPGSLVLYADLSRLRYRIAPLLADHADWLLRWSGLASARGVLMAIGPGAPRVSVLLETEDRPDGWLALAERMRVQDLVQRVPVGGMGGIAFALEPSKLLVADTAGGAGLRALRRSLSGGCSRMGLDLERQVLSRLGRSCSVQLLHLGGPRSDAAAVVSLQAKSPQAARRLFSECRQSMTTSAAVTMRRGARGSEQLVVRDGEDSLHLGVVGDAFSLAFRDTALDRAHETSAAVSRRDRQQARREMLASLQGLGAGKQGEVAGVFYLDLTPLAPAPAPGSRRSTLLRRHVGTLELEPGVLRIEILSGH